jgi:phage shock protein PspC (stress-responsive transcriptional regulator)
MGVGLLFGLAALAYVVCWIAVPEQIEQFRILVPAAKGG